MTDATFHVHNVFSPIKTDAQMCTGWPIGLTLLFISDPSNACSTLGLQGEKKDCT